jgi:DNA-binding GntR family transcriptional regulator
MRDLVGHEHSPSAFLVYLHLWSQIAARREKSVRLSHQMIANATGLSKSAVQTAIARLLRRRLVRIHRDSVTAIPEYRIARPWLKR